MATISKIRERSGWVIGAIAVAMFGFLVSDAFTSNRFNFLTDDRPKGIAVVNGEELEPRDFVEIYNYQINNKRSNLKPGESLSSEMEGQINDQLWNEYIQQYILDKEFQRLGLEVSGTEMNNLMFGPNPHPFALNSLSGGKGGTYNPKELRKYLQNFEQLKPEEQENWHKFEKQFTFVRNQEKFNAMVKNALFSTDLEAKDQFVAGNKTASVQYLPLFLSSIKDSIKVSDADLRTYYDAHKEEFKRKESRSIEYVSFDINITKADSDATLKWMNDQTKAFSATKNDSAFIGRRGIYTPTYVFRGHLPTNVPANLEMQIFSADTNTFIGPILDNGTYKLIKIISAKNDTAVVYHAKHILIRASGSTPQDTLDAEKKTKDIVAQIKNDADFDRLAHEKSEDPGSAMKGGELPWFRYQEMVPQFSAAVKFSKPGNITIAKSSYGFHIIKVIENPSNRSVKIGMIERKVIAGKETEGKAFNGANNFRSTLSGGPDFEKSLKEKGLNKNLASEIKPNDKTLPGLSNSRELVRWTFDAKKDDISTAMKLGDRYVVAHLVKITKEGYEPMEDVKGKILPLVKEDKKRDMLVEKLKEAREKSKSLEDIAKATGGTVMQADNVSFMNTMMPNIANEQKMVGYICGVQKMNTISQPIKGETAVFLVSVKSQTMPNLPGDFTMDRKNMIRLEQGRAQNEAAGALQDAADVKDYRYTVPQL